MNQFRYLPEPGDGTEAFAGLCWVLLATVAIVGFLLWMF